MVECSNGHPLYRAPGGFESRTQDIQPLFFLQELFGRFLDVPRVAQVKLKPDHFTIARSKAFRVQPLYGRFSLVLTPRCHVDLRAMPSQMLDRREAHSCTWVARQHVADRVIRDDLLSASHYDDFAFEVGNVRGWVKGFGEEGTHLTGRLLGG